MVIFHSYVNLLDGNQQPWRKKCVFFLQSYDANPGFRVKNHLLMDYRERCRQIHHTVR